MKESNRRFSGSIVRFCITIPAILVYLISLSGWYISPYDWHFPALFSPVFVWAWFFLIPLIFWWGKKNSVVKVALLVLILAGLPPMKASFSIGKSVPIKPERAINTLRVMQWNCMNLPGNDRANPTYFTERKAAADFIRQYQPDVICLEDFMDIRFRTMNSNKALLRDSLGYTWEHVVPFATELRPYGFATLSTAIYSKVPVLHSGAIFYTNSPFPEAIIWIDVALDGRPVRIVSTHFASMHFSSQKYFDRTRLTYHLKPDSSIIMSPNIVTKMNFFLEKHRGQAQFLRNFLDTCSIPVVLAADLNTVPANYLYRKVKGEMEDGFLGSKTGLGNTYNFLAPNLRIDYLLNDRRLKVTSFEHFENGFFDHDHLLADYGWRNP